MFEAIGAFILVVLSIAWLCFCVSISISVVTFGFSLGPIAGVFILLIVLGLWFN